MDSPQDAFLSYTRRDDKFFGGAITSLRERLELGVQVTTGDSNFRIFQDVDGIEFGENWQKILDQAIATTRFLIPIITPLFFQSPACRDELEKFIQHEKDIGRDDLILPVYFVTAPVLEKPDLLKDDPLATAVSARQRYDWRPRATLGSSDAQWLPAVLELSEKIASAISRTRLSSAKEALNKEQNRQPIQPLEVMADSDHQTSVRKPRRILWVDDIPDNNRFERKAMEAYGIQFALALSTDEALDKLKADQFDAIISDMGRPPDEHAGYTLLEIVRAKGNQTPYFIYAGSRAAEHVRQALSRGAQGSTNSPGELMTDVFMAIGID